MKFNLDDAVEVLTATPPALKALLGGLSDGWTASTGTQDNWQAFDVIGHLLNAEETNWIPRAKVIVEDGTKGVFEPFDRLAHFERSKGKTLEELLVEFAEARRSSISTLLSWDLTIEQLSRKGYHPELGEVTLSQLLATWVVHDLTHIRQIATAMAKKYTVEVGPWKQYLGILN
jgi:hypothetical protein